MTLFICVLFLSIILSCTDEETSESAKSYVEINGTQYELIQGALQYYGNFERHGVYNHSIVIFSKEININWDKEEASGTGTVLDLDFFNTQTTLADGTYTFSTPEVAETEKVCDGVDRNGDGKINDNDCYTKLPAGKSYISSRISFYGTKIDVNSENEPETKFKSGSVTLKKDGDNYTITLDCVGSNNDVIKGIYQGTLKYLDFSED